ncbi:hypothetical protein HPB48_007224 [Haemaphysalis longicornis]|uniref:Uncharacterized protein n=1 Tax=Haemaphysalis longicornis TaxID=44386 RepID=A0A9J6GIX8_HAELO|nr:hypothetical protein HPB48_007224 [Haemaphysalis longicornis]
MISAIAIAPPTEVEHVFETFPGSVRGELQPVMDYFEDNFIGRPTGRGRRQPRFPVELWNHHETALRAGFKTTNADEACTGGFKPTYSVATQTSGGFLGFCTEKTRCSSIAWGSWSGGAVQTGPKVCEGGRTTKGLGRVV